MLHAHARTYTHTQHAHTPRFLSSPFLRRFIIRVAFFLLVGNLDTQRDKRNNVKYR